MKKRDNVSEEKVKKILDSQMPDEEKVKRADFIIDNSGSKEETMKQVRDILQSLGISEDLLT